MKTNVAYSFEPVKAPPPPIDIQAALAQLWATRPRGLSDASHLLHRPTDSVESGRTVTPGGVGARNKASGSKDDDDVVTPLPSQSQIRSRTRSLNSRSPPPASFLHRKPTILRHGAVQRRASVVSLKTEEDIQAVAEMMDLVEIGDPSQVADQQQQQQQQSQPSQQSQRNLQGSGGIPTPILVADDGADSDIDNFDDLERPDSYYVGSSSSPASSSYPTSPASFSGSSMSHYFETDPIIGEYCDTAHLSPPQSPFPAFHLPMPKTHLSWDSLSDLPSLKSSASNSSLSTNSISRPSSMQHHLNVSPSTSYLPTPVDTSPRVQPLDVIAEVRISEEQSPTTIRYPVSPGKRSFIPLSGEDSEQATLRARDHLRERRGLPETLKLETSDPITIRQGPRSPAPSSGGDSSSSHQSPRQGSGSAFSRLFNKGSYEGKKLHKTSSHTKSNESFNPADHSESMLDISLSKAEEKKRKKELAKLRTEQLAIELKEKAKKRAAEIAAARAARGPKKATAWEEGGGMWGTGYL